ncbi:glutathione S-transferase protein [Dictyocaulus viviparus]|uniref:glutathione transferase n=1 Tax=Dictyocaulus viviparus TaxID=29172 RepID=A0A0D8XJR6_DICVI|nr:glutathione S-transferase protein [Dictyocaulus viviparus]
MVQYKLIFLSGRGPAECARQLFALADQQFEDVRLTKEQYHAMKSNLPFGELPVLEVDGRQLIEPMAINRFIARTFGLAGKNLFEAAVADGIADRYIFYRNRINDYHAALLTQKPAGVLRKLNNEVLVPARNKFFGYIITHLEKNSVNGYLVGDSITWIDVLIAEHVYEFNDKTPGFLDGFPQVEAHMRKIRSIPNIKKWIENRPQTAF